MTPFFDIGEFYTGFASAAMGGVDISLFIGLPVSGVLYWVFGRSVDLEAEIVIEQAEAQQLQTAGVRS